ncbi:MAG: peptide deformylase [Ruminococcaceae bacterium]|nr:peptide deformylase [Oscillospiraceae bacterium]
MIKPICKDIILLGRRSQEAVREDISVAQDLLDTLHANREHCVGMAANMIGVSKCIIAFFDGMRAEVMLNPTITAQSGEYEAEEGCLSLTGRRKTVRYERITVRYQDMQLKSRTKTYTGWTAQIIQHEIDHCHGIII